MNWMQGTPSNTFVGFAIEYQEPGGNQFYPLVNRLSFPEADTTVDPNILSSRLSPVQKFRWIHSPYHAEIPGLFTYRVTPVFMAGNGVLAYGDSQTAAIELEAETYPGQLNICFTRGFTAAQAFVGHFGKNGNIAGVLPLSANNGLDFKPTHPDEETALAWMGFEVRSAILNALDQAASDDTAQVRVAAYDFNDMEIVSRLQRLRNRLKIIIDDSGGHQPSTSVEKRAAALLAATAGGGNVQRQHMGGLQHNKMIVVDGSKVKLAVSGSINLSWRGIYVQNNNAVVLQGPTAVQLFINAFENMWANPNKPVGFSNTSSANWNDLQLAGIDAKVTFSPHNISNAVLNSLAKDIATTESSLFYSLAFLYQTPGPIQVAIKKAIDNSNLFVCGISDRSVGGLDIQVPDGNPSIAFPTALLANIPAPFKSEIHRRKRDANAPQICGARFQQTKRTRLHGFFQFFFRRRHQEWREPLLLQGPQGGHQLYDRRRGHVRSL